MATIKIKQLFFLVVFSSLIMAAFSCNSKTSEDETEIAVTPALVAVKNFYLRANDSILANLDSVLFSIDLKTGVIFNADSLPKGTDVSRLIASITFANTMTKAELTFVKDEEEEIMVNYLANPDDSIDFTHPVTLDVTAENGVNSFTYQIRVNVHKQEPDTLIWDQLATSPLPSIYSDPVAQKTVYRNETVYSLIEEYNGSYTLSSCSQLNEAEWNKKSLNIDFLPSLESFTATPDAFWILGNDNLLYSSPDGEYWMSTGEEWLSILGGYESSVLGIKWSEGRFLHTKYPREEGFTETPVEEGFPLYNSTSLGIVETEWYPRPLAITACGVTEEGAFSSAVWAYDGVTWGIINKNYLPSLEKPMMARYVVYRDTPYIFSKRMLDVWLLFGGVEEDGEMNRKVYMSYDNGVNWSLAPEKMQFPESMPYLRGADVIVAGYDLSADLQDAWTPQVSTKTSPWTRTSYTIDGFEITWVCPYLYIFGGYSDNLTLSTVIWRGVLARLEFVPLI